jgi:hypothetical protein
MRVAAGAAWEAARSIAQFGKRVDMALKIPSYSTAMVAKLGKARVNRMQDALLLAERDPMNQARG